MNFLNKKRNTFKENKKTEKIAQKDSSKNVKASQDIEEEQLQQNESHKKAQKLSKKLKQQEEEQDIDVEVEEVEEQNESQKKLSKKEKKELKKQQKLKQQQNAQKEVEEEEEDAPSESEKINKKQQQNGKKDHKKVIQEEQEQKKSSRKDKKKKQKLEEEEEEVVQKVEPKIIKKPKITIIEEEDSEGEVDKNQKNKGSDSDELQEEDYDDDSDLEELRRVQRQMKDSDDEDHDDSEEENFKDISSDEEDLKKKKKQASTVVKKQEVKSKPKKGAHDNKGKLVNLNEKIKLKHLAICIPDSIISIPQSSELRSYFISELARTAAIFCVDEIIILKDNSYIAKSQNFHQGPYIARNLQYLETPQYLRKQLFPIHPDLKNAGLMNPIECHHHLKSDQYCPYREGVVMNRPTKENDGSWVEIGLKKQAQIPYKLATNTRVTLRVNEPTLDIEQKNYTADVVSQKEPKEKLGLYWGYQVRLADNLSQVFKGDSEIKYDIKFLINQGDHQQFSEESITETDLDFSDKNVLIVFSGYNNLESIIDSDEQTRLSGKDALNKFDANFTMQKGQYGVKQLRLEEEMSHALSILRRKFN